MIKKWLRTDVKHLKNNNFSYFFHLTRALDISMRLICGGLVNIIHAFLPFVFTDVASCAVRSAIKKHANFPEGE
jgi:hypothetical protein